MCLLDQSGVTGGLDPYSVHALFVNIVNMWTERFGNYDCLVYISVRKIKISPRLDLKVIDVEITHAWKGKKMFSH